MLLKQLPASVQKTIRDEEAAGTTDSEAYQLAFMEFAKRFCCRIDPMPAEVIGAIANANMEVYQHMWGPSEWFPTGNLKNYERAADLKQIKVPTLFLCGRYDEATPGTTKFYHQNMPGSKLVVIEEASHIAYWEQPELYCCELRTFFTHLGV
jgi:proline iminopeptidase